MKQKFVHFDGNLPLLPGAGDGELVPPYVYVVTERALRAKTVALAAKRFVDMLYVTGLDIETATRHFRPLPAGLTEGLYDNRDHSAFTSTVENAWRSGAIQLRTDDRTRTVEASWTDPGFGAAITGRAVARPGYGGIVLGENREPAFDPAPVERAVAGREAAWPLGDAGAAGEGGMSGLDDAVERLFQGSAGLYGLLVASSHDVLFARYGAAGRSDRVTPSWSMTKAVTATLIGRMLHEGWLGSVYDRAPAPLWRNARDIRSTITLDDLMRMRSGLCFPGIDAAGGTDFVFEDSFVYYHAEDAFRTAQSAIPCTRPGSNYRYVNTGINVLAAIIRDQIERRGLPYHATVYGLLADRIGMTSYQHSADMFGNFIGSGAGFATLRDYARFGLLYLQDGVWNGERLLPEGWVDYALTPTHTGATYAACFRSNSDRVFPSVPADVAWASGASDQKVIVMRDVGLVVCVANEREHPVDLGALDAVLAACRAARPCPTAS